MNSSFFGGWGWAALSVLANVCASILLKMSARASVSDLIAFKDPAAAAILAGALAAYGAAFVAYFLTLQRLPVSLAYVTITSSAVVSLALVGAFVFREPIHARQLVGFALALAGLAFIVSGAPKASPPSRPPAEAGS
jgi:multidrug transporter EmrE-like cation transporter